MGTGYYLVLRILKPSLHFYWTHSPTTTSVNFWLGSLFFLVMTSWFFICCLKQWFLNPVSTFWDLQNLSTLQMFLFSATQPRFPHVCLSSWWEVTRVSLPFAQKQELVLGRPGIRNSPIYKRQRETWLNYDYFTFWSSFRPFFLFWINAFIRFCHTTGIFCLSSFCRNRIKASFS